MGGSAAKCGNTAPACSSDGCVQTVEDCLPVACVGKIWDNGVIADWNLLNESSEGNVEGIMRALKAGAFIETRGEGFIRPRSGNDTIMPDQGAVDELAQGMTPLMRASREGHHRAVQLLVHMRASVFARDEDGMQPLHFAVSSGSTETCAALISAHADPMSVDHEGRNALAHLPESYRQDRRSMAFWESLLEPHGEGGGAGGGAGGAGGAVASHTAIFGQRLH